MVAVSAKETLLPSDWRFSLWLWLLLLLKWERGSKNTLISKICTYSFAILCLGLPKCAMWMGGWAGEWVQWEFHTQQKHLLSLPCKEIVLFVQKLEVLPFFEPLSPLPTNELCATKAIKGNFFCCLWVINRLLCDKYGEQCFPLHTSSLCI